MHLLRTLICGLVIFACTGGAWAVLNADSFVAMRLIRNPYESEGLVPQREDGTVYRTGGISNAGDIFGDAVWPDDAEHREHFEQAVRWLRSSGYTPELVNGGQEHVVHPCCGGESGATAVAGEGYYGIHNGRLESPTSDRHRGVTPEGMAVGDIHVDVPSGGANFVPYVYDIQNDVLTVMPPGRTTDINSKGLLTAAWSSCCGSHSVGYYSKVLSLDAADADPAFEVVAYRPTFLPTDPFPLAINNQDIIVGNMGSVFSSERTPMKQLPLGGNTWSAPIALETLEEAAGEGASVNAASTVIDVSDNPDQPFGVGVSGIHAVVWDINAGTIAADFGALTEAWQISSDGTKVAGVRKRFFPPGEVPTVWSTDNAWADFTELELEGAMASDLGLEGADIWLELTDIDGVNDSGQVVGIGTYMVNTDTEQQGVFLLDTLPLDTVLRGDVNNDAAVDNLDITPFIAALAATDEAAFLTQFPNGNYAAADIDMSGSANNLDITPFIGLLTAASGTAVPEPGSLACIALVLMMGRRRAARLKSNR